MADGIGYLIDKIQAWLLAVRIATYPLSVLEEKAQAIW